MKVTRLKYVIAGIACICTIVAIITGILIFRENKLETIQNEALQELEARKGDYDEQTIVLTQTSYAKAEQLAELFSADLRITSDGRFAKLTLPKGTTIVDIYSNDDNRRYIPEMSADYVSRISDLDETEILEETGLLATRPNYTVSDSYYDRQTYLDYINMSSAWNSYKGNGITVAVIDTGIDTDHPEFTGRISEYSYNATEDKIVKDYLLEDGSYDWSLIEDEQGHGTAVAGVIGASMNNAEGITGIAPQVNIIVIKAECDENDVFASTADLVFGLYYAIERDVQIVNMSFGTYGQNPFALATKLAVDSDIICVAAAGNDATTALSYPAADKHVFGVGALGENSWELAPYSNYGENTNFVAPGTVYTTLKDGQYGIMNGTSFAAPVTAGVLALYVQNNQYKTFWDIEELLYASCADLGTEGPDWLYGYGALDVSALLLEEKGTVTFDMLTDDVDDIEQLFVRNHTLQNIPEPERLYAVFDGWYYDIECTDEFNEYEDKFTADLTLYAKWGNEEDGVPFTYRELDDGTIEITGYKGRRRYITIPDIIDEKKVTSIGDYAFANETRLREVGMPKYLVNIGKGAFQGCTNLLEMEIPSTVKTIGSYAFYADARLNAIVFGDGSVLDTVGDFAFAYCSRLTRFEIPENVSSLNGSAFFGSSEIRLFTLRTGNTSFAVNGGVLFNASATTLVAYPGGLRGDYIIPNAVKYIGDYAFGYARFSNVDLGNVERIGKNAFAYSQLEAINIPDSVKQMGTEAFAYSVNLRELTIGRGLSEISGAAFAYTGVVEVVIPDNITAIQGSAFQNSSLRNISFSEESNLISIGSSAFAWTLIESISIPSRVAQIGTAAFSNCMNLENVTFDENSSINILPAGVFSDTHALKSINIPSSVEHINKNAFKNTISLQTITLPSNLKQIADYAFVNSGITSITVPDTVELIGGGAFASCHNLENINVDDKNVNYTDVDGVVYDKDKTTLVAYPAGNKRNSYTVLDGTKTIGEAAFYGSWELSRISLANSVITLSDYAFYECRHMTHYALNNNLMYIKEYTFAMNTSLSSLSIPDNVIQIGRFAFYNDMNLYSVVFTSNSKLPRLSYGAFAYCGITSFKIPANISTMSQGVFMGCSALYSVTFEANSKLESISAYMFEGCNNLNTITFESGSNLTSLQAHAFDGLRNLRTINISDTRLTNIDNYAFRFCTRLSELKLPDTLTNIGRFAFYGCEQLSELVLPKDIEHIGSFAFYGANNMNLYMQSDFLPLYLDDNWDSGIGGYYLSTSDVIMSEDWKYAVLNSGNISIIEYLGTSASVDLTQLDFGGNIVSIGGYAFYFSDIEEITLPDTLINIERYAFKGSKLESVTIPASVRFIGRDAFAASAIKNVSFKSNSNLKVIEQRAFANTKNLSSITIPSSVDKMGKGVFAESNLLVIVFEDNSSLATIPEEAFAYTKIKEITIPDSITLIDHNAFRETTLLKKISFGSTNEMRIESNAFYHSGITEFNIPANITYVGEYAFVGLRNLTEFTVDENNPNYTAKDGVLMSKDAKKIIAMPAGKTGEYTVPDTVEVIGFGAFEDSKLSSIIFHENANVLTFGYRSFFNAQNITEITIPKSVMSIDYYAFGYCTSLSKVTFIEDNQLKGIYEGAFYGCKSLSDIKLPETVKEISDYAFYGCINLKEIPAGENTELQGIYSYAFAYTGITELDLPDGISDIGDYAFKGIKITSVEIPDENAKQLILGIGVFAECNYMEEITVPFIGASYEDEEFSWFGYIFGAGSYEANSTYVPESLKKIAVSEGITFAGMGSFYNLKGLEEIDVPHSISVLYPYSFGGTQAKYEMKNEIYGITFNWNNTINYGLNYTHIGKGISGTIRISTRVTTISGSTFFRCNSLTRIMLPQNITSIEQSTFRECNGLTEITIPSGVTSIGNDAFSDCSNLNDIIIPNSVTSIGSFAFSGCSSLTDIVIPNGVTSIGDCAFYNCSNLLNIDIPDSVIKIGYNTFGECTSLKSIILSNNIREMGRIDGSIPLYGCVSLEKIVLPDCITTIDHGIFQGFRNLKEIKIPESVTSIGSYAFSGCSSLTEIKIPESVTSIGSDAFSDCSNLNDIIIPNSVTSIGSGAFSGCSSLTEIEIPEGVTTISARVFSECISLTTITIPEGITEIGYSAFFQCSSLTGVEIPDTVQNLGENAFCDCSNLAEIVIPNSVTEIGYGAFSHCSSLTGVEIPESVTYIGDYAFADCHGLEKITIPNSVVSLGRCSFIRCYNLTDAIIGSGVTYIGGYAFDSCISLRNLKIGENVNEIGDNAFNSCVSLIELEFPDSITKIGAGAFVWCKKIRKVTIPAKVHNIENSTFASCSGLISVVFENGVTNIGAGAFSGCSSLTEIEIPSSVTSISDGAFIYCNNLRLIYNNSYINLEIQSNSNGSIALYAKKIIEKDGTIIGNENFKYFDTEDGFRFVYENNKYRLISYIGNDETVTLPDNINGEVYELYSMQGVINVIIPDSFTIINSDAFYESNSLTSVIIGKNVTSIEASAFYGCSNLTEIVIPNSVTKIETGAFSNCKGLTSIVIPEGVTSIGSSAFSGCSNLTEIVIPNSVTSIGSSAFYGCSNLTEIVIPNSVTEIGYGAFRECNGLTSIVIPEGVTSIEASAFYGCSNLTKIVIPNSVTSIGSYAFSGCSSLTEIEIPSNVANISSSAFVGCVSLKIICNNNDNFAWENGTLYNKTTAEIIHTYANEVIIPNNVTNIADSAFCGRDDLIKVVIPNSVTSIGSYAFSGCSNLTEIVIPNSVTSIGSRAFSNCKSLTSIVIPEGVTSIEDFAFDDCSNLTEIVIPKSVTYIGGYAFYNCNSLIKIEIPNSVTSIGSRAFSNCKSLTSIVIPEGVTSIEDFAFDGCSNLTEIVIPKSVTYIGGYAFYNCNSLIKIEIPNNVTSIGDYTFYGCSNLTEIVIPNSVTSIGSSAFSNCNSLTSIVIPEGVTSIEARAFSGCSNLTEIVIPNSVTSIGSGAFSGCSNLTEIVIPNSVTSIGDYTFSGCSNLTEIVIPKSVTYIGGYAFYNCNSLIKIEIPNNVTSIGNCTFYGCSNLTEIVIPNSVTSIGSSAFSQCISLTNVEIPNSVTKIGSGAFRDCNSLTSIVIPEGVTSIEDRAFSRCSNLTEIVIPNSVTEIGYGAFEYCKSLTSVILPDGLKSISAETFYECKKLSNITIPTSLEYIENNAFYQCNIKEIRICDIRSWLNINYENEYSSRLLNGHDTKMFLNNVLIEELYIPDGVEKIPDYAFYGIEHIERIILPDSVKQIGRNAFNGCSRAYEILLPSYLEKLDDYAFSRCFSLTEITIPGGIFDIGEGVFSSCNSLSKVIIPEGISIIGSYAFADCRGLSEILIAKSVVNIDNYAFVGCNNLGIIYNHSDLEISAKSDTYGGVALYAYKILDAFGNVVYETDAEYIDTDDGFRFIKKEDKYVLIAYLGSAKTVTLPKSINGCLYELEHLSGVINVIIPDTFKIINENAFYECYTLRNVVIPNSVTSIGDSAFYGCSNLTEIVIPNSVTYIGGYAFYYCNSLIKIEIPNNVTSIGDSTFYSCSNLTEIKIPESVTSIGSDAFSGCSSLTEIEIPNSVTEIGYRAFEGCSSLTGVEIPKSVTSIDSYAFCGCSSLTEIKIPESVTYIGRYAFCNCINLKNIVISNSVTSIGSEAFNNTAWYYDQENWNHGCLYVNNYLLAVKSEIEYLDNPNIGAYSGFDLSTCKYTLRLFSINGSWNDGLSSLTNLETLIITKNPSHSIKEYFGVYSSIPLTLKSVIVLDTVNVPDFTGMTGITIYLAADKDLVEWWNRDYPNWHNGNTVVCGGDWITAKFYNPDGSLYSYEVYKTSQVIKVPYMDIAPSEDISYELIGWDIDGDGKADSIPATSLVNIEAHPIIAEKERTHTITYYDHDGNVIQSSELPYGSIIVLPEAPIKKGYTFIEWVGYTEGMTVTEDIKIYANMKHIEGGHMYVTTVIAPTCIEQGYHEHKCSVCDDVYYDNYIASNEHIYGSWNTTEVATCTSEGKREHTCLLCGNTETEIVEKDFHDFEHKIITAATCISDGEELLTCKQCNLQKTEIVSYGEHDFVEQTIAKRKLSMLLNENIDMFYVVRGSMVYFYRCTLCNHVKTTHEEELSHSMSATALSRCSHVLDEWEVFSDPDCTDLGLEIQRCILCERIINLRVFGSIGSHTPGTPATCTTDQVCTVCGEVLNSRLGHNYTEKVTDPTCTEQGYTTHTCTRCQDSYVDSYIEAKGHNYTSTITDPTRTEQGYTTHTCTRCGDTYNDTFVPALGFEQGDINKDEKVTAADAVYLLRHIMMPESYPIDNDMNRDINRDGNVTNEDAVYLLQYTLFPEQYPLKGDNGAIVPSNPIIDTADQTNNTVTIESSNTEVREDDEVDITVSFAGQDNIDAAGIFIEFNDRIFQLTAGQFTNNTIIGNVDISDFDIDSKTGVFGFNFVQTINGEVFTFTVKIKEKVQPGDYEVKVHIVEKNSDVAIIDTVIPVVIKILEIIRGDLTDDDIITDADAVYLLRHVYAPDQYPLEQSGDMDGDGDTDADDAIYLLRHNFMPASYPLAAR